MSTGRKNGLRSRTHTQTRNMREEVEGATSILREPMIRET